METETMKYAHLQLGLTRLELKRRLELGQIDPEILKAQLDEYSREIMLDSLSEKWIELKSLDQVDKFETNE
ncbi:MAG: hypothetical protein WA160_00625 [Pseudobdellovibrio sp.]